MVASIISIVALGSALTCCSGCDGKRYFQERKKLAVLACTGLVQQTVQIVASHDLTLLVRPLVIQQKFIFNLSWSPEDFSENVTSADELVSSGELEFF